MDYHSLIWLLSIYALLGTSYCMDITVDCLDQDAIKIQEGGLIADCSQHGLTRLTTVMSWLGNISTSLQAANLSHNRINYLAKFPVLPRLLTLSLSHNKIKDLESLAVVNLINLQTLDLSYNRITGENLRADVLKGRFAPDHYEPLPIRVLHLGNNDIHSINKGAFEHLQYLRELRLDNNPLEVIDTNTQLALQSLPELKILDLARTKLSTIPADLFLHFQLTTLFLNGNYLRTVPAGLGSLSHTLRVLNINENPIEELNEDSFLGLDNLQELVISGMPELTTISAYTFSNLGKLKTVSCSYNPKLEEINPYAFWDHRESKFSLKQLLLNNNGLKRISKYLLPWDKLDKLTLEENPWVCDCRLEWLAKLAADKNTTIYRPYDLQCTEPTWENGTYLVNWIYKPHVQHKFCETEKELEKTENVEKVEVSSFGNKMKYTVIGLVLLTALIVAIMIYTTHKYRKYKVLNMRSKGPTSLVNNEVRYLKADTAEKTFLVS